MRILVIRFSAMGDVALVAPVLQRILSVNEEIKITMLSRPGYAAFFEFTDQVTFYPADVDHQFQGVNGIYQLFSELGSSNFDVVVDLHDNLRSRGLCTFFRASGVRIIRFDKGRKEKKKLLRKGPVDKPLMHTTERYTQAFQRLGIQVDVPLKPLAFPKVAYPKVESLLDGVEPDSHLIGIAPFAKHREKIWPIERMVLAMEMILEDFPQAVFFLFGGGSQEIAELERIKELFPTSRLIAGLLPLREELQLISRLDMMISMDSANMHLASLLGVRVISIWGPTHPYAGFGPLFNEDLMIQSQMEGRPFSIYGKSKTKKNFDRSIASMESVIAYMVYRGVRDLISGRKQDRIL